MHGPKSHLDLRQVLANVCMYLGGGVDAGRR